MHNNIFYIHKDFILHQEDLTLPRSGYSESFWRRASFPIYYSKSLIAYAMLTIVIDLLNNLQVIQKYQDDQQKLL